MQSLPSSFSREERSVTFPVACSFWRSSLPSETIEVVTGQEVPDQTVGIGALEVEVEPGVSASLDPVVLDPCRALGVGIDQSSYLGSTRLEVGRGWLGSGFVLQGPEGKNLGDRGKPVFSVVGNDAVGGAVEVDHGDPSGGFSFLVGFFQHGARYRADCGDSFAQAAPQVVGKEGSVGVPAGVDSLGVDLVVG